MMNDKELDKILSTMQIELSDAWERYEGTEVDDLDEYGELYDNAYAKAKKSLQSLLKQAELEGRAFQTLRDYRQTALIDNPKARKDYFDKELVELEAQMEKEL